MTRKIDLSRWEELREEKIPSWIAKKVDKLWRTGNIYQLISPKYGSGATIIKRERYK